ncbi:fumarylacetoacetate (FAA) hydrolase [Laceyella tengchongensis]|uniref:Fumarylacetoacetate (FAA) hydrolase n=1 Tax=Laceyella tengchongensis TaxID=574699 RepID=A0AA45WMU9_9BACL|nr:fumarylacetoacetate hydrolase family protein [Laceyella tengchongensis]SMP15060.1 fumarylacetoacetate (FAA) hydrolase [Laceyella tengchongensis]
MKLVTYMVKADELNIQSQDGMLARLGWVRDGHVIDVGLAQQCMELAQNLVFPYRLATDMLTFLQRGEQERDFLQRLDQALGQRDWLRLQVEGEPVALALAEVDLFAPIATPSSLRDFYAFEEHVRTCRQKRGLGMVPQWYEIPVFYFSNHQAVIGPEAPVKKPAYTNQLDYELEIACVIGKRGKNIKREEALAHIAGFMIMNDWSARDAQLQEVAVGLGPAKGKDFATSLGPWLVTTDELEDCRAGERWSLTMRARVNGRELSKGNTKDLHWTFAQMIERASAECELVPGDVIGSGTVGTGCLLELGEEVHPYLQPGDVVELEIERLGLLRNTIVE